MKPFEHIDNKLLDYIMKENLSHQLYKGDFGLEKENVRVDEHGSLALTPHPKVFGDKLQNPYIKTDFSESQIEVVTPVCDSIEKVYSFLENLQNIVSLSLKGEYLWPQSNPPLLPEDAKIPIAVYEKEGQEEREYRERLAQKYGRKKQLISGIHFNFSFNGALLRAIYSRFGERKSYKDFKDNVYLKTTKNFLKYRWFLIYLTGASPILHSTFHERLPDISQRLNGESYYIRNLTSFRNSNCGYKNDEDFIVNYDSLEEYIKSIQALIDTGKIGSFSEFYSPIRLKGSDKKAALETLSDKGIKYLELRIFDLNPFNKNGVCLEDLQLINLFMIYMFLQEDKVFDAKQQEIANINHNLSAAVGTPERMHIYNEARQLVNFREGAIQVIEALAEMVKILNVNVDYLIGITQTTKERILNPNKTYANRIIEGVKSKSYLGFHMEKAKEYYEEARKKETILIGYEDLELSTQILVKDAIKRGISFDIVDREENFIKFSQGAKVEYVKQATKTSCDSYSSVLVMENKVVTKEVLKENNIAVPLGLSFSEIQEAKLSYSKFKEKRIVIKPKLTNFGLGISILKDGFQRKDFERALEIAFSCDKTVLIEEFVNGKEYRFLVIDNQVIGVLQRVPANVQGDGKKTIEELVSDKNKDPLRGEGHKTPLEKIKLGEIEEMTLRSQGKDFKYIPKKGEVVFLRENSNISTGGDSIDYTDGVHQSYKDLAVKAAKAVGAVITGVDMIVKDITKQQDESNYAIIELNFNPAIYMHCYPYKGTNRKVGDKILDFLFR